MYLDEDPQDLGIDRNPHKLNEFLKSQIVYLKELLDILENANASAIEKSSAAHGVITELKSWCFVADAFERSQKSAPISLDREIEVSQHDIEKMQRVFGGHNE